MCHYDEEDDEVLCGPMKPVDLSPEADKVAMEAEFAEDNLRPLFPKEIEAEAIEDDIHDDDRRPRHHR